MAKPTEYDIANAVQQMEESEDTLDDFIEYLEWMDPQDFRKYWGSMDIPAIRSILEEKGYK